MQLLYKILNIFHIDLYYVNKHYLVVIKILNPERIKNTFEHFINISSIYEFQFLEDSECSFLKNHDCDTQDNSTNRLQNGVISSELTHAWYSVVINMVIGYL